MQNFRDESSLKQYYHLCYNFTSSYKGEEGITRIERITSYTSFKNPKQIKFKYYPKKPKREDRKIRTKNNLAVNIATVDLK